MSEFSMFNHNKVTLAARLTRDPELRYTPQGTAVCQLGLAATEKFKTRDGEAREETLFIDATAWKHHAEFAAQYLKKGRPVFIEGKLKLEEWEDKQTGQNRQKIKINVLDLSAMDFDPHAGLRTTGGHRSDPKPSAKPAGAGRSGSAGPAEPAPEDDIPF